MAPPIAAERPMARPTAKMSKAEALRVTRRLKRGLVVTSLVAFGGLVGLAASHATGVTAALSQTHAAPTPASGDSFFDQQDPGGNIGAPIPIQRPIQVSSAS
jgi:hypothetical protein